MTNSSDKPLIMSRVMLVGEAGIPRHVLQDLGDEHMRIFLREPNFFAWPDEMSHLIPYLPEEERIRCTVSAALKRVDHGLLAQLDRVAQELWDELSHSGNMSTRTRNLMIDELVEHMRRRLEAVLEAQCESC